MTQCTDKKAFTGLFFLLIGFANKNATEKGEKQDHFFCKPRLFYDYILLFSYAFRRGPYFVKRQNMGKTFFCQTRLANLFYRLVMFVYVFYLLVIPYSSHPRAVCP